MFTQTVLSVSNTKKYFHSSDTEDFEIDITQVEKVVAVDEEDSVCYILILEDLIASNKYYLVFLKLL
jgi:hypothetical protein